MTTLKNNSIKSILLTQIEQDHPACCSVFSIEYWQIFAFALKMWRLDDPRRISDWIYMARWNARGGMDRVNALLDQRNRMIDNDKQGYKK